MNAINQLSDLVTDQAIINLAKNEILRVYIKDIDLRNFIKLSSDSLDVLFKNVEFRFIELKNTLKLTNDSFKYFLQNSKSMYMVINYYISINK